MSLTAGGGADLWVRRAKVVGERDVVEQDVLILDGRVQQVARRVAAPDGIPELRARGRLVFPGLIDTQVHFREPGLEHKEDLASGSLAAVTGGITAFCEMPNTDPPTTDPARLVDKLQRAHGRSWADHAFFLGATADNADRLGDWEWLPGCAGIKVFMGSSTGNLLVPDDATLERVLRSGTRRVAVHSEDEPRLRERYGQLRGGESVALHPDVRDVESALRATRRLLDLAEKTGRKVHLLHVSTAEELDLVRERDLGELVTVEATPNHLFLAAPYCYERHGSLAQMNPPVRDLRHQDALRRAVAEGLVACIGSDHAPHTLDEKAREYPRSPSGIPGVQTTLPLLLTAVRDGWLTYPDIVRLLCTGPARVYGFEGKGTLEPGSDGDLVIVDPRMTDPLPADWLRSRAGFSPFVGTPLAGLPVVTVVRGHVVSQDGESVGAPIGRPLRYRA
ncbi:MAG: dihydroorotase [Planctomycetes bacterium]|nr:dihydroorotase [Planctomycetota bacterium]